MIFFYTKWSILNAPFHVDFKAPIDTTTFGYTSRGIWQRRFLEHTLRDERDWVAHMNYIHYNPVKHGLTNCPHAWPYSTFERYVKEKIYEPDWQCVCNGRTPKAIDFGSIDATVVE